MSKLIIITFCLLLSACYKDLNSLTQDNAQDLIIAKQYQLKVEDIQTIEQYSTPFTAPNLEHQVAISPSIAVKKWIDQSLSAVGEQSIFQIIIKDASIIENKIDSQHYIYEAKLHVNLSIIDSNLPILQDEIYIIKQGQNHNKKEPIRDTEFFSQLIDSLLIDFIQQIEISLYNSFANIIIN